MIAHKKAITINWADDDSIQCRTYMYIPDRRWRVNDYVFGNVCVIQGYRRLQNSSLGIYCYKDLECLSLLIGVLGSFYITSCMLIYRVYTLSDFTTIIVAFDKYRRNV